MEGLFTWNDTSSQQGSMAEIIKLAELHGCEVVSIVLKADKEALLERNKARNYSVPMDEFDELYNGAYGVIDDSEVVVDSTDDNVAETIEKIKSIL